MVEQNQNWKSSRARTSRDLPPIAVIFDNDGFLMDTERIGRAVLEEAAGLWAGEAVDILPYIKAGGKYIAAMAHDLGFGKQADEFRDFVHQGIADRINTETDLLMPGILPLLDGFRDEGLPLAVASQTAVKATNHRLVTADIRDYFQVVVGSDQVKLGKPHPALFRLAASRLGISPRDCIVIGDSDTDPEGARRAGMMAIQVSPEPYSRDFRFRPHLQVESATQLTAQTVIDIARWRHQHG